MPTTRKAIFLSLLVICLLPAVDPALALFLGTVLGLAGWNPWPRATSRASGKLLKISVIGLGFGVSIGEVWQVGFPTP